MDQSPDPADPVIARLAVPLWRRLVGLCTLSALTLLLARLTWAEPAAGRQFGLGLAMLGAGLLTFSLWRATAGAVLLRASGRLETDRGQVLVLAGGIASVEAGAFAFRPSNGFLLRLKEKAPPGWAPGLWWRLGRRLGVGGLAQSAEVKAMAAALTASQQAQERSG